MGKVFFMTFEERQQIEKGLNNGFTLSEIGMLIGRAPSSIHYEIKKNVKPYNAEAAQNKSRIPRMGFYEKVNLKIEVLEKKTRNLEYQLDILLKQFGENNGKN